MGRTLKIAGGFVGVVLVVCLLGRLAGGATAGAVTGRGDGGGSWAGWLYAAAVLTAGGAVRYAWRRWRGR